MSHAVRNAMMVAGIVMMIGSLFILTFRIVRFILIAAGWLSLAAFWGTVVCAVWIWRVAEQAFRRLSEWIVSRSSSIGGHRAGQPAMTAVHNEVLGDLAGIGEGVERKPH
jgi:hypothetical protein